MLCRSMFVLLSFFFWPLCFLSFFDLRIKKTYYPFGIFKLFLHLKDEHKRQSYPKWKKILANMESEKNKLHLGTPDGIPSHFLISDS
jgi:hypothetical protein